jgi:hypothetical protein
MNETIIADGTPHDVEVRPITLICHHGNVALQVPGRVEIGPEQTLARTGQMTQPEWDQWRKLPPFAHGFKTVFNDQELPERLPSADMGVRHIVGLLVLLIETVVAGGKPFLRLPESFLHPRYQLNLADLLVQLSNGGRTRTEEKPR